MESQFVSNSGLYILDLLTPRSIEIDIYIELAQKGERRQESLEFSLKAKN